MSASGLCGLVVFTSPWLKPWARVVSASGLKTHGLSGLGVRGGTNWIGSTPSICKTEGHTDDLRRNKKAGGRHNFLFGPQLNREKGQVTDLFNKPLRAC